jgi:hypothetical protein
MRRNAPDDEYEEKLDDRLARIRMQVRGTAVEGRLVRANSELERQRDRLT